MKAHLNTQTKKYIYTLGLVGALFSTYSFHQKTESLDLASMTPTEEANYVYEGKTYKAKYYKIDDTVYTIQLEASNGSCTEFCDTYTTKAKANFKDLSEVNEALLAQLELKNKSKAKPDEKTQPASIEDKNLDYLANAAESCNEKTSDSAIVSCHKTTFIRLAKEAKNKKISDDQLKEYWKENVRDLLKAELEFTDDEYDYSDKLSDMKDYLEDIKDEKGIPKKLRNMIVADIANSIKSTYQDYLQASSESVREKGREYQNDLKQASFDYQSGMLSPSELPYIQSDLFEQRNELLDAYKMSYGDARKAQSIISSQQGLIANSSDIFRTHFEKPMTDLMIQMRLDPAGQINPIQSSLYHPSIVQDPFTGLSQQSNQAPAVSSRLNLTGDRFALYNGQDPNQLQNQNSPLVNHQAVLPQNGLPTVRNQQQQQSQYNNVMVAPQNNRLLWKGF